MRSRIFYFFCVLGISACNYREVSAVKPVESVDIPSDVKVDFVLISERIFIPSCLSCHSAASGNIGQVNLETYEETSRHFDRLDKSVIQQQRMPPGNPIGTDLAALLKTWIDAGAPE
jgi:uncharacterized membrane protein